MKKTTERVKLLEKDRSFKNFFNISCMTPNNVAAEVVDSDYNVRFISYAEFRDCSYQAASFFNKRFEKVEKGSFICISMDNSYLFPYVFWGLVMSGFNPVMLDFRAEGENIKKYLYDTGAKALISDKNHDLSSLNVDFLLIDNFSYQNKSVDEVSVMSSKWGDKIVFCTSGTTGDSRIFVFTEHNFISNLFLTWKTCEKSPYVMPDGEVKYLAFLPVYHIYGFYIYYGCTALCGNTVVYMPDRKPETLFKICQTRGITHMPCVPLLFKNIVNKIMHKVNQQNVFKRTAFKTAMAFSRGIQYIFPISGQKFVYKHMFGSIHSQIFGEKLIATQTAGAYMPPEVNKVLLSLGFPMYTGLGTTETIIVSIDYGRSFRKKMKSSMGVPFEEFKILDLQSGEENGREGVLYVRGDSVHSARLKEGKLIPSDKDAEGWYCTNDIVKKDRKGNIYFLSRSKDVIIPVSGENIYPDQLEAEFGDFRGIKNKIIIGVETSPGAEEVYMILEPESSGVDYSAVYSAINRVNKRLPVPQNIYKIYISEKPFPVTSSLKVQRQKMKSLIEKDKWPMMHISEFSKRSEVENNEISEMVEKKSALTLQISRVFADVLGKSVDQIDPAAHFIVELGGDSLTALQLAGELEKKFDIFVSEEHLRENVCVNDYVRLILEGTRVDQSSDKTECKPVTEFTESREFTAFAARIRGTTYNPYFIPHDSIIADTSIINGKSVLNFASYNYLGLSGHPEVINFTQEAVAAYGTSASGSRVLTGEKTLYQTLEKELAQWKGTEDSIVLVSGNATNTTFVGNFCGKRDLIVYDMLSHDSISQGIRLSYSESRAFSHNNYKELDEILSRVRKFYEKVLIVIEGVYSMDGDIAPVPEFVAIKKKYGAFLMVDEAHSTGVLGKHGKGVCEYFNLKKGDVDIYMGTLSKSLGSCGGYLAGNSVLINYLRYNLPGFVFSVGIPPASAAAALAGIRVISKSDSQVVKLHTNIKSFFEEAVKNNFNTCDADFTAIIPILVGDDDSANKLCKVMLEDGIFIVPAVYPAVAKGQARLRFCVTSEHKDYQIKRALQVLRQKADELNIKLPETTGKIPHPVYELAETV
ncbi:MAG: aminotransferase class I/II-fold pyridoxal phosphate-dependent enzyme [Spirochaetales bacterium]|nr:aminotransferase class I/II-fold pyridoxal phosphate-dependent enzyme [Spirochaetales bacterium]